MLEIAINKMTNYYDNIMGLIVMTYFQILRTFTKEIHDIQLGEFEF